LWKLLHPEDAIEVVGKSGGVADATHRNPAVRPDAAPLDMRPPDGSDIDLLQQIPRVRPAARSVILTSYTDDAALFEAFAAGAAGHLLKEVRGLELFRGIREVTPGAARWSRPPSGGS
jgi:DNA-binding NarL/FixJ family response regulator